MINPALNTDRITRQSGKFTYHPSILDRNLGETKDVSGGKDAVNLRVTEALIKLTVGDDSDRPTESIRKELGIMNVHHGSLFPDHDGFASYVNDEWGAIATNPCPPHPPSPPPPPPPPPSSVPASSAEALPEVSRSSDALAAVRKFLLAHEEQQKKAAAGSR